MNEAQPHNSDANATGGASSGGQAPGATANGGYPGGPPTGQAPSGQERWNNGVNGFLAWIRSLGVRRTDDRWLGGVAGGLAERTGLDPMIVRGIFFVVALLGGPALFFYAVGWALLPDTQGRIHLERVLKGIFDPASVAIMAMVLLTFTPFTRGLWWQGAPLGWSMPDWLEITLQTAWVLLLIGGITWLVVYLARRTPRPPAGTIGGGPGAPGAEPRSHADFWTSPAPTPATVPTAGPANAATTGSAAFTPNSGAATGSTGWEADGGWLPDESTSGYTAPRPAAPPRQSWDAAAHRAEQQRLKAEKQARAAESRARAAEASARRRRRQPGAAFVAISLGLAVMAGAVSALVVAPRSSQDAIVLGTAVALGVLAIATIVSGVRGRVSGGLGFFSFVSVIVLLVVGIFPSGTTMSVISSDHWSVVTAPDDEHRGHAVLIGGPVISFEDLSERAAQNGGVVELWMAVGNATIILPDDVPLNVEINGTIAAASSPFDDDGGRKGGVFLNQSLHFNNGRGADTTTVRVWTFLGHVDIVTADEYRDEN